MGFDEKEMNLLERTFVVTGVVLAVVFSLVCVAVLLWPGLIVGASAADAVAKPAAAHSYAGVDKCKKCHKTQYESWVKTKHAGAFADASKKPEGVTVDPEVCKMDEKSITFLKTGEAIKCLACHTTGYDEKTGKYAAEGVTCEACHGGGADFATVPIMKNKEKALAAGLVIPTESTCRRCHRTDNPMQKETFDFEKSKEKVPDHVKKQAK